MRLQPVREVLRRPRATRRSRAGLAEHVLASMQEETRALGSGSPKSTASCRSWPRPTRSARDLQAVPGVGSLTATAFGRRRRSHPCLRARAHVRELARIDAARVLQRRAATARTHQRARRPLPAVLADPLCARRAGDRGSAATRRPVAVPSAPVGAAGSRSVWLQQGHARGGQQAGSDRVGRLDAGRRLRRVSNRPPQLLSVGMTDMASRTDRHRTRPIAAPAPDADTTCGPRCATSMGARRLASPHRGRIYDCSRFDATPRRPFQHTALESAQVPAHGQY